MRLNKIKTGEKCIVKNLSGEQAGRLRDLGFCENSTVTVLYKSPSGDPTAYFVRGTVIALRQADAEQVEVRLP